MGDGSESLQRRTEMDYKEQAYKLELRFKYDRMGLLQLDSDLCKDCADAGKSIIELLARAEGAEAANTQLDGTVTSLMASNKRLTEELKAYKESDLAKAHEALTAEWAKEKKRADEAEIRCKTLEKMVKEYQETIIPGYRKRSETAESIASDLCDDFTDFVTGGVHNAAPYCDNRRPECVNAHGWCDGDNRVCRGFVPRAAARNKDGGFDVPLSQQGKAADPQR